MTSLLGRLLHSFPGLSKENSFTEVVAFLFETRPRLCLAWLKEEELIDSLRAEEVARFFIESIRQLREELTTFKKEHPDVPWRAE